MTLHLHTAHYSYIGPDRVDITRYGCDCAIREGKEAPGVIFAPSADLVYPIVKHVLPGAEALLAAEKEDGVARGGGAIIRAVWYGYKHLFRAEMDVSHGLPATKYGHHHRLAVKRGVRPAHSRWQWWLQQEQATFVCLCTRRGEDGAIMCHRVLVAERLQELGAVYEGERKGGG